MCNLGRPKSVPVRCPTGIPVSSTVDRGLGKAGTLAIDDLGAIIFSSGPPAVTFFSNKFCRNTLYSSSFNRPTLLACSNSCNLAASDLVDVLACADEVDGGASLLE